MPRRSSPSSRGTSCRAARRAELGPGALNARVVPATSWTVRHCPPRSKASARSGTAYGARPASRATCPERSSRPRLSTAAAAAKGARVKALGGEAVRAEAAEIRSRSSLERPDAAGADVKIAVACGVVASPSSLQSSSLVACWRPLMPAAQHRYVFDDGRLKSLLAQSLTYDPVRVRGSPTVRLSLVAVNA